MTLQEFSATMAYLSAGIGKPIAPSTVQVYFDLLQDLPAEALQVAVQQALLENHYPVIPAIGSLRGNAINAIAGANGIPTAMEAWGLAQKAMIRFGYYQPAKGFASLPPIVQAVARMIGWQQMCDSTETEILRAQFCRAYETVLARDKRLAILPAVVRGLLDSVAGLPLEPAQADKRSAWQIFNEAGGEAEGARADGGVREVRMLWTSLSRQR